MVIFMFVQNKDNQKGWYLVRSVSPNSLLTTIFYRTAIAHNDSAYYREAVQERSDETIANIAITLLHQEDVFLRKLIDRLQSDFLKQGGIREQMLHARLEYRKKNGKGWGQLSQ